MQHDANQVVGVIAKHRCIARERGKNLLVALAIRAVAGRAVVQVQGRSVLLGVAPPQCVGRVGAGGKAALLLVLRGQRFQIHRNRFQIAIADVLRAVRDHIAHAAKHCGVVVAAGFEQGDDVGLAPGCQAVGIVAAQAFGDPAVHGGVAAAQKAAVAAVQAFFGHGEGARRVAGTAVAQAFDQIGAAQFGVCRGGYGFGLGLDLVGIGGEHAAPDGDGPAHGQRPGDVVVWHLGADGLDLLHEVGVEVLHVLRADLRVRRVGHGGVEAAFALVLAVAHGLVKLFKAVAANACGLVRRDVAGVHGANGRAQWQAACKRLAAGCGVAGHAVAHAGQVFAAHQRVFGAGAVYLGLGQVRGHGHHVLRADLAARGWDVAGRWCGSCSGSGYACWRSGSGVSIFLCPGADP